MAETKPVQIPPLFPEGQQAFANWLFGLLTPNEGGGYSLAGAPAYPGATSPDINSTILPSVYGAWQPQDAGQAFLSNYMNNGWMMGQPLSGYSTNLMQYGGVSDYLAELMHTMAQYGGVGEPAKAMSGMMQYGAPSQAGQPIAQTAQTGGYGDWGKLLAQRAQGQGPAMQFLAPYLGAPAYNSAGSK